MKRVLLYLIYVGLIVALVVGILLAFNSKKTEAPGVKNANTQKSQKVAADSGKALNSAGDKTAKMTDMATQQAEAAKKADELKKAQEAAKAEATKVAQAQAAAKAKAAADKAAAAQKAATTQTATTPASTATTTPSTPQQLANTGPGTVLMAITLSIGTSVAGWWYWRVRTLDPSREV